ncbi:hypothetical protein JYU34_006828 [Plutella xylostella]|uniref:Uncharacterized protein n=1 Tax=Plutella xylostella TaxID=51655 RepID=A0ABQ7QT02_PLUXY|nr:hypothetical protein JYU34_006828 [Plutella xylostella]
MHTAPRRTHYAFPKTSTIKNALTDSDLDANGRTLGSIRRAGGLGALGDHWAARAARRRDSRELHATSPLLRLRPAVASSSYCLSAAPPGAPAPRPAPPPRSPEGGPPRLPPIFRIGREKSMVQPRIIWARRTAPLRPCRLHPPCSAAAPRRLQDIRWN